MSPRKSPVSQRPFDHPDERRSLRAFALQKAVMIQGEAPGAAKLIAEAKVLVAFVAEAKDGDDKRRRVHILGITAASMPGEMAGKVVARARRFLRYVEVDRKAQR